MADDVDVLLKLCEEQWTQCRQLETQRSTVTHFVITVTAAILAFISHKGFVPASLPLGVFLFFLGLYGAITSEKLYERWQFTVNRARLWCKRINELKPNAHLLQLQDIAHKEHHHILQRVHLHWLWVVLHISIATIGLGCIIVIIIKMV
jgi:hypothetical protein